MCPQPRVWHTDMDASQKKAVWHLKDPCTGNQGSISHPGSAISELYGSEEITPCLQPTLFW